jgi:hypothetical protein
MQRAMARQAEAERERRAKIIMSDGELQAAQRLAEAARLMAGDPAALQLRLYQTMVEVSSQPNMTIVLPVPVELLAGGGGAGAAGNAAAQAAVAAAAQALTGAAAKQLAQAAPPTVPPGEGAAASTDALKAEIAEPARPTKKSR